MNLLFDIGGTKMRFSISDNFKTLQNTLIYPSVQNYREAISFIKEHKDEITQGNSIEYISGGIAGVVQKNELFNAPHLLDWIGKPLANDLKEIFGAKDILVQNDAALAALAESVVGAGKDFGIVAYLTISTGIGGARVINKYLDESYFGFEPGHQIININNGQFQTFESLASGSGIEATYGQSASEINTPQVWSQVEDSIAYGLNNVTLLWSPEVIILGGGIINSNNIDLERVRNKLSQLVKVFPKIPELKKSELGEEVGLYGALFHLKNKYA